METISARKQALLDHLDSVFFGEAWHGAALIPTMNEIGIEDAATENDEGYSPWRIALHCAYWKFFVRKAISDVRDSLIFERSPDDFPDLPEIKDEKAWKADIAFLEDEHRKLVEAVRDFPDERLDEIPPKAGVSYGGLILGAASHDAYHTAHIRNLGFRRFS